MTKEKKARRASGGESSSSRGASKRPASPSRPSSKSSPQKTSPARKSRARKQEDRKKQKRRKTEQAVRKASARASERSGSTRRRSSQQRKTSNQQRPKTSSPTRGKNASARGKGASVRNRQNSPQRKRPAQGANMRRKQPEKKRKPTAAEIARRKKRRNLIFILLAIVLLIILIMFTMSYVSNRIQDQSEAVLNDKTSSFAPIACTPENMDSSIKVDAPPAEDTPITLTVTLRNNSREHPCYIDVGRGNTNVKITSGDDMIVPLSTCEDAGKEYKQLLIDRNMTTSFTLTWNRHRNRECSVDAPTALPGMYKVVWTTEGSNALEAETFFEIKVPPAPEPEPTESTEGSENKPAETPTEEAPAQQ